MEPHVAVKRSTPELGKMATFHDISSRKYRRMLMPIRRAFKPTSIDFCSILLMYYHSLRVHSFQYLQLPSQPIEHYEKQQPPR